MNPFCHAKISPRRDTDLTYRDQTLSCRAKYPQRQDQIPMCHATNLGCQDQNLSCYATCPDCHAKCPQRQDQKLYCHVTYPQSQDQIPACCAKYPQCQDQNPPCHAKNQACRGHTSPCQGRNPKCHDQKSTCSDGNPHRRGIDLAYCVYYYHSQITACCDQGNCSQVDDPKLSAQRKAAVAAIDIISCSLCETHPTIGTIYFSYVTALMQDLMQASGLRHTTVKIKI